MVKLFVLTLLAIVAAVALVYFLDPAYDPGYLLIVWRNYTFETSLLALVVLVVTLVVAIRLLALLLSWLNPWRLLRVGHGRRDRTRNHTTEGLLCLVRSNWEGAYRHLEKSFADPDATVINYLAAAYAAFALKRQDLWEACLDKAAGKYPVALSTVNALRGELLLKSNRLEQSGVVLEQLQRTSINDRHLLRLLKDVYFKLQDWEKLRELMPALEKEQALDAEELERVEKRLFTEELQALVEQLRKDDLARDFSLAAIMKKWKKAPHKYRDDDAMVGYLVELLLAAGAAEQAARIIEEALDKVWHDALIEKYGVLDFAEPARQLANAENWLQERPNNGQLLLALGRIAMRNRLWDKAREYYEASMNRQPAPEVYGELARLLSGLGDAEGSRRYLNRYLESVGKQLPELPLPVAHAQN
jgi:HemY protein